MDSFFAYEDHGFEDEHHPLASALLAFDACRSQAAHLTGFSSTGHHLSEPEVIKREPVMSEEIMQVHNSLPESEQLRIYRFYLTAVHRNSVVATRFDPAIMSSHERSAAMEAEFDDISHQLDELIIEVAARSLDKDVVAARLHAADFLWTLSWWVHVRRDVLTFAFDRSEDPLVLLLLGRCPDPTEVPGRDLYKQTASAELEYSNYVSSSMIQDREPKLTKTSKVNLEISSGSSNRIHVTTDDWHM